VKAIFVLLDSLNRNYLPIYGNDWVKAPNIERLANHGITMENHWLGSAPCMPARRDILTGRLNFLERGWGPIEPYDIPFTRLLRESGIRSHMETDHYHYFHVGGENYHTQFDTYQFHRGQEQDPWQSRTTPPDEPEHMGQWGQQYYTNQKLFSGADDFPTPKTFIGAIDWLKHNEGADDYVLWVEGFDPHEPFDCPADYVEQYGDTWDGPLHQWTGYRNVEGDEKATQHLRNQYAGTLTMADEYLGKMLDELERQGIYEETLIILTTDHGHLIGEHGVTGKNRWHVWNELGNLPMIAKLPGNQNAGQRRKQLTQNTDVMPTLLDYFNVEIDHDIHGESLKSVFEDDTTVQREAVLYGWFGMPVNITDGKYTYMRAAIREENDPLFMHYQIPTSYSFHDLPGRGMFREAELGPFLPFTQMPVVRARTTMRRTSIVKDTQLFNIKEDPGQENNLATSDTDSDAAPEIEKQYIDLLKQTLKTVDAPASQYKRLGL
jgi:arylsulfatase A-like enzyme|tara:strand:- start:19690 stop:21165 length:1476 start_codon:yes stop_codon:yes gene_type:complete